MILIIIHNIEILIREDGRILAEKFGKEDGAVVLLQCEVDFEEQFKILHFQFTPVFWGLKKDVRT